MARENRKGACKTQLHAAVNKAMVFNHINLPECEILDNRVERRTDFLREKVLCYFDLK